LAKKVGTSQQQISRLESPCYEGHSLSMLRRVTEALGVEVHIEIYHKKPTKPLAAAERKTPYRKR
jgi:predicted transcriptional regulator